MSSGNLNIVKIFTVLFFVISILSGCTHAYKPSADFEMPSVEKKIPVKIGLYLSPQYCNYSYEEQFPMGDKFVFELGDALCQGTEKVVKTVFYDTVKVSSPKSNDKTIKAIIIPEILLSKIQKEGFMYESEALLIGKWTVVDADGKLIWVDTFQGNILTTGGDHSPSTRKRTQLVLEDYFQKVYNGVLSWKLWESIK